MSTIYLGSHPATINFMYRRRGTLPTRMSSPFDVLFLVFPPSDIFKRTKCDFCLRSTLFLDTVPMFPDYFKITSRYYPENRKSGKKKKEQNALVTNDPKS